MRPLIIANWKMNPVNSKDAFDLAAAVQNGLQEVGVDVVLCPPFVYIPQFLATTNVFIGAQDAAFEQEGAYTGQISSQMLKNLGCSYVILGHSERRKLGETLEMVAKKIQAALDVTLIPVVCIGEDIEKDMQSVLKNIKETDVPKIVFVYEPKEAISTEPGGKATSPEQLERALSAMHNILLKKIGKEAIQNTTILYGGSVSNKNIKAFMEKGVQGALVGAASLDAQEFIQLAKNAISG